MQSLRIYTKEKKKREKQEVMEGGKAGGRRNCACSKGKSGEITEILRDLNNK